MYFGKVGEIRSKSGNASGCMFTSVIKSGDSRKDMSDESRPSSQLEIF